MSDELLDDLNDRQREAVTSAATPLAILAGAGSGKTRVLTYRIAWQASQGLLDPRHALAVTFTRKAAGELAGRLARLGVREQVTAGTFHALALAQLRRRATDQGVAAPTLLDRKVGLLISLLGRGRDVVSQAVDLAGEIEWAKARLTRPDEYEGAVALAGRPVPLGAGLVADVYARYEHEKARRGLVDFDDLLLQCADAIESDRDFAAAQRWRFRHLFVDEFQDVNPAHFRLVRAWLGDRSDLCVVGDDDQAIYGFSGADAGYLVDFRNHFPQAEVVRLEMNYRSTPQILVAAGAVLPTGLRSKQPLRPVLADGPIPVITEYPDDKEEATGVAKALRSTHEPGVAWSSTAVLYRTNAQSAAFEAALSAAGIPFRVRGAARFLERAEVRSALARLEKAVADAPGLPFSAHLSDLTDPDGAGDADTPIRQTGRAKALTEEEQDHAQALVRLGNEYLAADGGNGSLEGFRSYLATSLHDEDAVNGDAVEFLSFHRAKGLEWPTVFVTGMERGLVPIAFADTPAAHAEERRLVYVAITRAARNLHLSWAARRTTGSREFARKPSPYLSTIEAALKALGPEGTGDWRAAIARERERLKAARSQTRGSRPAAAPNPDPQVMDALVAWRRDLARASGVPAYVIFHDTTLAAVADARPKSHEALLALPGLGPIKVERYGDALLDLVRAHAS